MHCYVFDSVSVNAEIFLLPGHTFVVYFLVIVCLYLYVYLNYCLKVAILTLKALN